MSMLDKVLQGEASAPQPSPHIDESLVDYPSEAPQQQYTFLCKDFPMQPLLREGKWKSAFNNLTNYLGIALMTN